MREETRANGAAHAPRCSGCGIEYLEAEWARLQVTERIPPSQVRYIVRDWPESMCIEVRRCGRCGRAIAAKRPE